MIYRHAKQVLDLVFAVVALARSRAVTGVVEGFVDDDPSPSDRTAVIELGGRIIGTVDQIAAAPTGSTVVGVPARDAGAAQQRAA